MLAAAAAVAAAAEVHCAEVGGAAPAVDCCQVPVGSPAVTAAGVGAAAGCLPADTAKRCLGHQHLQLQQQQRWW